MKNGLTGIDPAALFNDVIDKQTDQPGFKNNKHRREFCR